MTWFLIGFIVCLGWSLAGLVWHVLWAVISPWWKPSWLEKVLGGPVIWFFLAISWMAKKR